ncbi:MAG: hypothetical protein IJ631_03715 [Schwartzia sp.]|nr:hypothetical protein [Schwartzia sp. (in: firmicutes)]
MSIWKTSGAALAAALLLFGTQPAMAAYGLSEDEIGLAKTEANKLVPKKRVSFAFRSHSDAEILGDKSTSSNEPAMEAEAYLLTPFCHVMSLQLEQGRTGHVDFAALENAGQTYQLRLKFDCHSFGREDFEKATITVSQSKGHDIEPTARRYTLVQRAKELGGSATSRIGIVLDLPATQFEAELPIEVTVKGLGSRIIQFHALHADGAFDQYDTKSSVFAWSPLHTSL